MPTFFIMYLFAIVVAIVFLLTGCGGSGGDSYGSDNNQTTQQESDQVRDAKATLEGPGHHHKHADIKAPPVRIVVETARVPVSKPLPSGKIDTDGEHENKGHQKK